MPRFLTVALSGYTVIAASLLACKESGNYSASRQKSEDINIAKENQTVVTYDPTNQVGGIIAGRTLSRDPKLLAELRQRNANQPIYWGQSIGTVSLDMPEQLILDKLSTKLEATPSRDRFAEGIQIVWKNTKPRMPELIAATQGYFGRLNSGAAIGDIFVGRILSDPIDRLGGIEALMRELGRVFEKKPDGYDCRAALTCRLSTFNNLNYLDFSRGGIALTADDEIAFIYLRDNSGLFFPRIREDIIFGQSIAGISLTSTLDEVERQIGPPQAQQKYSTFYYDDFNLSIAWKEDDTPLLIAATSGYLGKIIFPNEILPGRSVFSMGESMKDALYTDQAAEPFTSYITSDLVEDTVQLIAIFLGNKIFKIEDDLTNCLEDQSCSISETDTTWLIDFQIATIGLTKDDDKKINLIMMIQNQQ